MATSWELACAAWACIAGIHFFRRRGLNVASTPSLAVPPEPLTDLTDWDWQVDAELPVPRLPFAVAPGNAEAKELELAPQSPSVSTDIGDDLRIPAQASMMEGLRLLLLHHLRDPLSPQQMELLERHVAHLASYAEKLVNLLHRMRLKTQARLTLKDEDLLDIYRSAQDEAQHGLPIGPVREVAGAKGAKLRTPRAPCDPGAEF